MEELSWIFIFLNGDMLGDRPSMTECLFVNDDNSDCVEYAEKSLLASDRLFGEPL